MSSWISPCFSSSQIAYSVHFFSRALVIPASVLPNSTVDGVILQSTERSVMVVARLPVKGKGTEPDADK